MSNSFFLEKEYDGYLNPPSLFILIRYSITTLRWSRWMYPHSVVTLASCQTTCPPWLCSSLVSSLSSRKMAHLTKFLVRLGYFFFIFMINWVLYFKFLFIIYHFERKLRLYPCYIHLTVLNFEFGNHGLTRAHLPGRNRNMQIILISIEVPLPSLDSNINMSIFNIPHRWHHSVAWSQNRPNSTFMPPLTWMGNCNLMCLLNDGLDAAM